MSLDRRTFLKAGALAAAVAAVPRPLMAQFGRTPELLPPIDDPRLKELTARALEAARGAGARYADVRLTHTRTRRFFPLFTYDEESMEVGVRSLVDGYWGFASGPVWSVDEMARLGRESVRQAKTNALGKPRVVDLAAAPVVQNGNWVMPVGIDPFEISPFEAQDFLVSLDSYSRRTPGAGTVRNGAIAESQSKAFASTLGSYFTQRCRRIEGILVIQLNMEKERKQGELVMGCVTPAGLGWELYTADRLPQIREHSMFEEMRLGVEGLRKQLMMPVKPVDVGRYDAVMDARTVANLVDATLGRATELDRAMGYEANAGGTSYLNDPIGMIGSYQAGAPALNMTGNRAQPGGCATVKWDDEGVAPEEIALVKDGVLTDFQTTRESATWLKDYYGKNRTSVHSNGCAAATSAVFAPMQRTPNLVLGPGRNTDDFDTLVKGMEKGIAIKGAELEMDFQAGSGLGTGSVFEVKQGKIVANIASAGFLFRATELWKALHAVGGEASAHRYGMMTDKGEPGQNTYHSVTAPPGIVSGLTLVDPQRKA
jgi:TldD protein